MYLVSTESASISMYRLWNIYYFSDYYIKNQAFFLPEISFLNVRDQQKYKNPSWEKVHTSKHVCVEHCLCDILSHSICVMCTKICDWRIGEYSEADRKDKIGSWQTREFTLSNTWHLWTKWGIFYSTTRDKGEEKLGQEAYEVHQIWSCLEKMQPVCDGWNLEMTSMPRYEQQISLEHTSNIIWDLDNVVGLLAICIYK